MASHTSDRYMMSTIRLLDLGFVSPVRSQTVYHAVAYAMTPTDADTIILVSPTNPYICIGYHQDIEKEVDLSYCDAKGLPVVRREVGGGATYLDAMQVFTQWIFHLGRLPSGIEQRFALHARPLVETYHTLGIPAYHRPVNDIQVAGKKIGGMGAARIGMAEVLVSSLMFDFDVESMTRVLKVSSEKMRDKVHQSLRQYMTTLMSELGHAPDREMVKALYVDQCRAAMDREIVPGALTEREEMMARQLDERFVAADWLYQQGKSRQSSVKIHQDVVVVEADHKAPGGLIRVTARLREERIEELSISGDFTLLPATAIRELEQAARGLAGERDLLLEAIRAVYTSSRIQSPGVTPEDFTQAILAAIGQDRA
jgi:lipoate-protein ligase A